MKRLIFIFMLVVTMTNLCMARRTVTPVGTPAPTPKVNLADSLPGDLFIDSIAASQPKAIGNIYPLWDAIDVSIDLWPAVNRAFRSGYGIAGLGGRLSLHNRYFPAFEIGLSSARSTPDGMNYSFRSPVAPYFKIGMDYNFMYNSNPDYQAFALVRYGFSAFEYRFIDVDLGSSYWDTSEIVDFPWRRSVSGYFELGAGLKVKLWRNLAAGWSFRYHKVIHHTRQPNGSPWAIPGFGVAGGSLGLSLSITYTFPLHEPIIKSTDDNDKK